MKHKVSELTGALLDAAVALADGRLVVEDEPGWEKGDLANLREEIDCRHVVRWYGSDGELGGWEPLKNQGSPSTEWAVGGPIIEREGLELLAPIEGVTPLWRAQMYAGYGEGPTPLIAAMRAFVASKLGEEVEL